jgi:dienelactone hydrolase
MNPLKRSINAAAASAKTPLEDSDRNARGVAVCYGGVPTPFAALAGNLPPTLVLHGALDQVVPVAEAHALVKLLRRHQKPHDLHIYPEAGHGFCGAAADDAVARIAAFFHQHLNIVDAGPMNA